MSGTNTSVGAPQTKRSKHNLSSPHFTTTDLFKVQPVWSREVIKGDHFNIKMAQINRVDALPVSSFVEINNRHDWFYVKMSQIWKPFEAFMSGAPYAFPTSLSPVDPGNTVPNSVPYLTPLELLGFFMSQIQMPDGTNFALASNSWIDQGQTTPSSHKWDMSTISMTTFTNDIIDAYYKRHEFDFVIFVPEMFVEAGGSSSQYYLYGFKLNSIGRFIYGIFNSLGYRVPKLCLMGVDSSRIAHYADFVEAFGLSNYTELAGGTLRQSFLPLMAYMSIIVNYYVPTKWRDYKFVNSLSYLTAPVLHFGSNTELQLNATSTNMVNGYKFRGLILQTLLQMFYGSDYFTDSLEKPYAAVGSATNMNDPSGNTGSRVTLVGNGQPAVDTNGTNVALTEYLLAALKSYSTKSQIRALTKNNIIGSMLQQFGIKPEVADMKPYLLSTHRDQIVVEPEVAAADTFDPATGNGTPLGFKAGTGQGYASSTDDFDFDDYGFLICVNSVSPVISYAQGLHREMLHTGREHFFDEAKVNLGYQPIVNAELTLCPVKDNTGVNYSIDGTFGFQNKFAEYGYPRFSFGGDFCVHSVNRGLDAFHFIRDLDFQSQDNLVNSELFAWAKIPKLISNDYGRFESQYDRIFQSDDPNYDHIQQWTYFKVLADRSIPANGEFVVGDEDRRTIDGTGVTDNINM